MPPTISDWYRNAIEELRKEVDATSDDVVIGVDVDEWVEYLVSKYEMSPIELDESRGSQMEEVETETVLRGYDIYSDRGPGDVVRRTQVRVEVPVVPSDTIAEIWRHGLAPNSFHLQRYPEFEYHPHDGCFALVADPGAAEVKAAIDRITAGVRAYNVSIEDENRAFSQKVSAIASAKRANVQEKHKGLDNLSAAAGIPLKKKADPSRIVPTAPKVRTKVAPVMPPASKLPARPVLEQEEFAAILDLLDNGCRQFERTPQAFRQLTEEGLRDILLGNLNAVFEGAAGGETFQGIGKVDIHLRISQGEIFVAEVKFWDGPASLHNVIGQLRGRLTWRDGHGVALVLSRNVGFTDVLRAVHDTIGSVDGFGAGSLQARSPNPRTAATSRQGTEQLRSGAGGQKIAHKAARERPQLSRLGRLTPKSLRLCGDRLPSAA